MVNFGPLTAEIGSGVWDTPANFNGFRVFASLLQRRCSPEAGQPNFSRCLAVSWADTLYIRFRGLLSPDGISPRAKFTLGPSLAFSYIGSVTARHSSSGVPKLCSVHGVRSGITELSQKASPILGWAAITLGIGPHSSYCYCDYY